MYSIQPNTFKRGLLFTRRNLFAKVLGLQTHYQDLLSAVYVEQAKQNGRQYTNDHYTDDSVDGRCHGSVDDRVAMVHHRLGGSGICHRRLLRDMRGGG